MKLEGHKSKSQIGYFGNPKGPRGVTGLRTAAMAGLFRRAARQTAARDHSALHILNAGSRLEKCPKLNVLVV